MKASAWGRQRLPVIGIIIACLRCYGARYHSTHHTNEWMALVNPEYFVGWRGAVSAIKKGIAFLARFYSRQLATLPLAKLLSIGEAHGLGPRMEMEPTISVRLTAAVAA